MKMTSSSRDAAQTINLSMKEGFLRTDIATKGGFAAMIMDFKNQQMIILMDQQKMYMVRPIPAQGAYARPQGEEASSTELVDTGVKETILGFPCTKYLHTSTKGTSEIWATDQLGTFTGLYHGGGPQQSAPAWESALRGRNFFPMRVVTSIKGQEKFRLEVTSVEKASLADSLFAAPDGWRKFDMGAMMGGAMQGGSSGARPSDGNN